MCVTFSLIFNIHVIDGNQEKVADEKMIQDISNLIEHLYHTNIKDCTQQESVIPRNTFLKMKNISYSFNFNDPLRKFQIPLDILHKCLFSVNYSKELAPYLLTYVDIMDNTNYAYSVKYSVILNELIKLDASGIIGFTASFEYEWNDLRLKWSENTSLPLWFFPPSITVNARNLWIPKLIVKNCQRRLCPIEPNNVTNAYIESSGTVKIYFTDFIEATCSLKFRNFPFDEHHCTLNATFVNLDDGDISVQLIKSAFGYSEYMAESDEWTVTSYEHYPAPVFAYLLKPELKAGKWIRSSERAFDSNSTVIIKISAIRMTTFYVTNVLIPLLIIITISIATVIYPKGSSEKVNTLLSVILSFVLFQTLLASALPKTRDECLLALFVMWSMLLGSVNLLFTFGMMVAIRHAATTTLLPPSPIKYVTEFYKRYLCRSPISSPTSKSELEVTSGNVQLTKYGPNKLDINPLESEWINTIWVSFADLFDKFFNLLYICLNILIFVKYMFPLLLAYFNNLNQKSYFADKNDVK